MSGDFLSRWSKRKRALVHEQPPAAAAAGSETTPLPEDLAEGETLPPEELAKLPSLDSLTAQTDLTQFLRAGVPMVMRKAALRRMWSLDTNIRDYVSEAREYAYDWNVVGGVPGNGPLLPTDDIKAMLRDIFDGTPVDEAEQNRGSEQEQVAIETDVGKADGPDLEHDPAAGDYEVPEMGMDRHCCALPQSEPTPSISEPRRASAEADPPRPRRHGGAIPL